MGTETCSDSELVTEATRIIDSIKHGNPRAAADLLPLVYDELRRLAAFRMAQLSPGQTLQPTALVHEAYLRLVGDNQEWNGRGHFFAAAAEAMRRILVERTRRKAALRHGGGQQRVNVDEIQIAGELKEDEVLAVNDALEKLTVKDPQKAELVKLRYFVGLTIPQAAEVLGISTIMAKRHWTYSRAFLLNEVRKEQRK